MSFGAPLNCFSRQCRQPVATPTLRRCDRLVSSRQERRAAAAVDSRLNPGAKQSVPRVDPKRTTRCNAVQQPPLLGTHKGHSIHLDIEYFQLLGLHNAESLSESKIVAAFTEFSNATIEEGYSARAKAGRQQLLEEAKEVALKSIGKKHSADKKQGIDLPMHLIPGATAILTDIREHELVLRVGKKVLESPDASNMQRDIFLSMALAKLGQAEYYFSIPNQVAMACTCMREALNLLLDAGSPPLALPLRKEIEAALETYVPKCLLDQLKLSLTSENVKGRKDAIKILREVLEVPRQAEYSQVGVDRHYVKQVMDCMTSLEILQIINWTRVLSDPKCVKWYYPGLLLKGAAVHIVVGFLHRRPALLRDIDNLLSLPGKDREAHVEHVICKLLLGEVERAFDILDKIEGAGKLEGGHGNGQMSGDDTSPGPSIADHAAVGAKVLPGRNETLTFIKAHSDTGNGDYVPGLCVFFERWMRNAGLPQFRDTASEQPSLSLVDYFNDRKVKNFLNSTVESHNGLFGMMSSNKKEEKKSYTPPPATLESVSSRPSFQLKGAAPFMAAPSGRHSSAGAYLSAAPVLPPVPYGKRKRWLVASAFAGAVLGVTMFSWIRYPWMVSTKKSIEKKPVVAEVMETEVTKLANVSTERRREKKRRKRQVVPLKWGDAEELVKRWQSAKAKALGPKHEFKHMRRVLTNPVLEAWSDSMKEVERKGWYYKYDLDHCKVTQMNTSHFNQPDGYVDVVATLKESAVLYRENGQEIDRYKSRYNVAYHVVIDEEGRWKINDIKVMKLHA